MQIIPINPGQVFVLELDSILSENEKAAIVAKWNLILPNNPVIVVKKGSLSILSTE